MVVDIGSYEGAAMRVIQAIYEQGVFRPLEKINLPEHTSVELQFQDRVPATALEDEPQSALWTLLKQRFEGDDPRVSERHNEHQP